MQERLQAVFGPAITLVRARYGNEHYIPDTVWDGKLLRAIMLPGEPHYSVSPSEVDLVLRRASEYGYSLSIIDQ